MRRLVLTVTVVMVMMSIGLPARAGGATWEFEDYHRPGDVVESTTGVAWAHGPGLGTPADGPFLVYLLEQDATTQTWPEVPESAMLVGAVEVRLGPYWSERDRFSIGPHTATARFEIPDLSAGIYQIIHCNDPCTTTLGDIVGGWDLRILPGDSGRPAEVIAAEVRELVPDLPRLIEDRTAPDADRVISMQVTSLLDSKLVLE